MYDGATIGVIIPAYNEEGFVGDVIEGLPDFVDRTYAIDDSSTDGTWDEIRRHAERVNDRRPPTALTDGGELPHPPVVPIRHGENGGRGGAVKTGYHRALDDGLDVIAVLDGDGQMDPAILDRLIDPIVSGEADYAKGNRLLSRAHRDGMSAWRLLGNTLLTYLTKVASGYWRMMDPQNGYTAISARTLRTIELDDLYDDYGFLNDMLVKLNAQNARVADVAMRARYGDETSGIRYSRFIPKLSWLLLHNFWWRLKVKYLIVDFHPLVQFYGLGAVSLLAGLLHLVWTAIGMEVTLVRGTLTLILFLLGGLFVTLAMTLDRAHNEALETRVNDIPDPVSDLPEGEIR